jgi:hypothetical protein
MTKVFKDRNSTEEKTMAEIENFSEKVAGRLTRQREENIQKKGSINEEMQDLIKQREAFQVEARRVLTSVVLPRIRAVALSTMPSSRSLWARVSGAPAASPTRRGSRPR